MHFLMMRPSQPKLSHESLCVLSCTAPTFRARARNSSWRGPPRILELRANVILLLREDPSSTTTSASPNKTNKNALTIRQVERVHEVSKSEGAILSDDGTSILLVKDEEVKYSFCDRGMATAFRDALHRAMRAHARAPSYVVLGKVPNVECMNVQFVPPSSPSQQGNKNGGGGGGGGGIGSNNRHGVRTSTTLSRATRAKTGTKQRTKTRTTVVLARSWEANATHSRLVTIKSYNIDDPVARSMAINERNTLKYLIETKRGMNGNNPNHHHANNYPHQQYQYHKTGSTHSTFLPCAMHCFETKTSLAVAYTDRYCIPLCDLHTLMNRLPRKRLPTYIARTLFAELLLALHDLHTTGRGGIACGDIRPRNIWITRGGHIRLCEFSRARVGTDGIAGGNGSGVGAGPEGLGLGLGLGGDGNDGFGTRDERDSNSGNGTGGGKATLLGTGTGNWGRTRPSQGRRIMIEREYYDDGRYYDRAGPHGHAPGAYLARRRDEVYGNCNDGTPYHHYNYHKSSHDDKHGYYGSSDNGSAYGRIDDMNHHYSHHHHHHNHHDKNYNGSIDGFDDGDEEEAELRRYANPERTVSREGDIWSLGITLLQMLTGYTSTHGHMARDLLEPAQRAILARMLVRDPAARASARELMGMRWLRNVDLHRVRSEADVGMPRDDILRLGRKVGISAWNAGDSGFHLGGGIGLGVNFSSAATADGDVHTNSDDDDENTEDIDDEDEDENDENDDNVTQSEYAKSEWSRMTREFCRIDGAFDPDGDDLMMGNELSLQNARLRSAARGGKYNHDSKSHNNVRRRRPRAAPFRRKVQVEHGRVLGFGLNMSNERD